MHIYIKLLYLSLLWELNESLCLGLIVKQLGTPKLEIEILWYYLPTPPLGQDMTQDQFLSGV